MELTINETKYPVVAGHGATILCCERLNIEFYEFHNLYSNFEVEQITTQHYTVTAEYTKAIIERGGLTPPDKYDIIDWLGDSNNMVLILKLIYSGFQPKNSKATKK